LGPDVFGQKKKKDKGKKEKGKRKSKAATRQIAALLP
jgi:hypothetical protein